MRSIKYPCDHFDERPEGSSVEFLILHSTECDLESTLRIFTDQSSSYPVSAHYVVCEKGDIYALVDEKYRAWHAGKDSRWLDFGPLNATSIGIEVVNIFPQPFKQKQMESVLVLSKDIIHRYSLESSRVLAHSDIALGRKTDPGPFFDWYWLAGNGVGLHPRVHGQPFQKGLSSQDFSAEEMSREVQDLLKKTGYAIAETGTYDEKTCAALRAFQMKFRQSQVDGKVDEETFYLLQEFEKIQTTCRDKKRGT